MAAMDTRTMICCAADLLSDGESPGENEYDRAIVELVGQSLGIGLDVGTREAIETMLRGLRHA